MGLFKKARSNDKGEGEEAAEASLAFPLSQSVEDAPAPAGGLEATPEAATADGPATDEAETAPGSEGLDLESVLGPLEGEDQGIGDPGVGEDPESSSDEEDDDLMDIFAAEEEEDMDLATLTRSLEEIDTASLLAEARDVASNLRDFLAE